MSVRSFLGKIDRIVEAPEYNIEEIVFSITTTAQREIADRGDEAGEDDEDYIEYVSWEGT